MIAARLRRWACLPLLWLACMAGAAAQAPLQLAFLRPALKPAPETETTPRAALKPAPAVETTRPTPAEAPHRAAAAEESPARQALGKDGFHDPKNPDLIYLQRHDDAMAGVPKDANGFPDWMRALKSGAIAPRSGLAPGAAMSVFDLDIVMKNTKEMPWVRFPHNSHTAWLDCSNCHPQPFEPRAGAAKITMAEIFRGKFCGMCHDRVAFVTFFSCQRCHSEPQAAPAATRR